MFKPLVHFVAYLERSLPADSTFLPVSEEKHAVLSKHFANNDWFHIAINDGVTREVAKIVKICGKIALIRAEHYTKAKHFICGSKVSFILTPEDVENLICNMDNDDCEENMQNYRAILDWTAALFGRLDDVSQKLPLSLEAEAALLSRLEQNNYTYLKISNTDEVEIVKVTRIGDVLVAERGVSGSNALTFPRGSCVDGVITAEAIRAIVCSMDCCP